jgi:hypothetical protein
MGDMYNSFATRNSSIEKSVIEKHEDLYDSNWRELQEQADGPRNYSTVVLTA